MTRTVETLTAEAFAPFGRVISQPERARDAEGPGWRWWAETVLLSSDGRPFGVGFLDLEPAAASFDWAEKHRRTQESVIATTGDILLYVASAEYERAPAEDAFRVFRIPGGSGVVLDRGVWHGAPLAPSGATTALVLILEGTGRHDVVVERFDAIEIEREVTR
jgi:ureidoglycolate hydrolase